MSVLAAGVEVGRNQIEGAVAHAALGHHGMGEFAHVRSRSAQDHRLHAVLVVEVGVHGRHGEVVVRVLGGGQPLGQVALVVVVDVGQRGDAVGRLLTREAARLELLAQDVAHRFRAVVVAALADQPVEFLRQLFVEGDGEAFHEMTPLL